MIIRHLHYIGALLDVLYLHEVYKGLKNERKKFDIIIWKEKLKGGADINKPDESGLTALEQAILDANINAVEFCIKQGADVNIRDDSGKTALWYTYKNYRARKILLHYKEHINRIDKRKIIK